MNVLTFPDVAGANEAAAATETDALVALGRWLLMNGYRFVTVTPETHRIVNERTGTASMFDLRDVFGWSRAFRTSSVPEEIRPLLDAAHVVVKKGLTARSSVRFSTIGDAIFVHSAYPTTSEESVFFGPDTYRFVQFIHRNLPALQRTCRIVDVGCGSGAGGLSIARAMPGCKVVLADVNETALLHARVNARLSANDTAEAVNSDVLNALDGEFDLIVSNPPYMKDALNRRYRDGGRNHGTELSLRIVRESLTRLAPRGRLLLYTGSPVIGGTDLFFSAVVEILHAVPCTFTYAEIDPDVFGEELRSPGYEHVERIAAVGLVVDIH